METQDIIEIDSIYDYIKETFSNYFITFDNVRFKGTTAPSSTFPLIMLHSSGVYIFADLKIDDEKFRIAANQIITYLKELIEVNSKYIYYFGLKADEENNDFGWKSKLYIHTTKQIKNINNLIEHLYEQIEFRSSLLSNERIQDIELQIKNNLYHKEITLINKEGTKYILKKEKWYEVSEIDEIWYFHLTLFFGIFGFHKFSINQVFKGFLYLITLGLFGVGWFFDNLRLILGCYRFKKRHIHSKPNYLYIAPLENKVTKLVLLLALSIIVYYLILLYINSVISIASWLSIGKI